MSEENDTKINLEDYEYKEYYNLLCEYSDDEELSHSIQLKAFEFLCKFKNIKKITEDKNALILIKCLNGDSKVFDEANIENQTKFTKIFITLYEEIFNKFKKELGEFVDPVDEEDEEDEEENEDDDDDDDDEEEDQDDNNETNDDAEEEKEGELEFMSKLGDVLALYTYYSTNFATQIIQNKGLKILFEYLKVLIEKVLTLESKESLIHEICENTAGAIFNLSKLKHLFVQEWKDVDALDTLFNFSFKIKDEPQLLDTHLIIYGTIAFIFEEKDLEKLKDIQLVVKSISSKVENYAKGIKKGTIQRIDGKVHNEGGRKVIVAHEDSFFDLIELFECLYRLAVSDSIKYDIYFPYMAKDNLRDIIYYGNEFEKEYALKLLWQLCFEKKVADHVRNDNQLYSLIKEVNDKKEPKELVQCCSGMIWLIDEKSKSQQSSAKTAESISKTPLTSKHMMISYNSKSKELCLKIKAALEKAGYKIWIDVENIHGSSLEAMATAIEESSCILMCMTEKYKQSANCRLEAEYSVNQNKPIIPLIMEKGYKPDGWLGIILGSKIFIDFTKYEFEECFNRLMKEVIQFTKANEEIKNQAIEKQKATPVVTNDIVKAFSWSEQDVKKWFDDKKFVQEIVQSLEPCNGELLAQLNEMYKKIPEYFYSSINQNKTIKLRDLLHFTNELKKLFKQ